MRHFSIFGALACVSLSCVTAAEQRPFTVADSIELTRLVDPNSALVAFIAPRFKVSPDAKKLLVVTRRGNLQRGVNDYSLILFSVAEIAKFVNSRSPRQLPSQDVLLTMSSFAGNAWYQPAIDQVSWQANSRDIAFVARDGEPTGRACLYEIASRKIITLTDPSVDVASFAVAPDRKVIVYSAYVTPDWEARNRHGYVIETDHLSTVLSADAVETPARKLQYFVAEPNSRSSKDIGLSPGFLSADIAISPTGSQAVVIAKVQTAPEHWGAYDFLKGRMSDIEPPTLYQAMLIELPSGEVRPLLDAPLDPAAIQAAQWSKDGQAIYLASTYLPLDIDDTSKLERRRRVPTAASIDASSRQLRVFKRPVAQENEQEIQFSLQQGLNEPPEISAKDTRTGRHRTITDLNPQLRDLTLGVVRTFQWRDRLAREFIGGLVLPPNYTNAKRYPVVLQTRGFYSEEFLVDGPLGTTTTYAARALANQGLLVLQMPNVGGVQDPNVPDRGPTKIADGENPRFVAMMEGAIDALVQQGLASRERIGVAGFSRGGMNVQYAITFSNYPIAAAIIADAIAATPLSYTARYGEGMREWEHSSFIGAPFFGAGVSRWLERSPIFHLDRIRTPLRYEVHGTKFIPEHWDSFAILKREGRPVEMIHIPFASHNVEQPWGRLTSQQGSVDWFVYWLTDSVDPAAEKTEQFIRWRKLRNQRDALLHGQTSQAPSRD